MNVLSPRFRLSQSCDTLDCAVNTHLSLPFLKNPPLERFKRLIITHTVVHPLLHLTYTSADPRGLSQLALRSALSSLPCPVISAANARNTLAVKKASYPASCCCSCTPYRICWWWRATIRSIYRGSEHNWNRRSRWGWRAQRARFSSDVCGSGTIDKNSGIFTSRHIGCIAEIYFVSYTLYINSTFQGDGGQIRRKRFDDGLAEFPERRGELSEELTPDEHEVLEKIMSYQDRLMCTDHFENFA